MMQDGKGDSWGFPMERWVRFAEFSGLCEVVEILHPKYTMSI